MDKEKYNGLLSGNLLKIIALISMTLDHIGVQILTSASLLRVLGRLAFPIFAYMIAEGCRYTRNRKRYICSVGIIALICQIVYYIYMRSVYQCIFVTFFISILLIYVLDNAVKKRSIPSYLGLVIVLFAVYFLSEILPVFLYKTDFSIDYGFFGIILPVIVYFCNGRLSKIVGTFAGLAVLSLVYGGIQWFSLLSLPLLMLYNGKRGRLNIKWFFYIYYPLHLVVIYIISLIMDVHVN